jgi:aerobic carbon-monoxide dehydrogenase large subunit
MSHLFGKPQTVAGAGTACTAAAWDSRSCASNPATGGPLARVTGAPASAGCLYAQNPEALPRSIEKMLTGGAVFVDDIPFADQAHGYVLRSPHPHARIRSIDVAAARWAPGVLAVLTGADVASMAGPLPCVIPPEAYGRTRALPVDRPILAIGRVRHVGDGVAFIVAETLEQAEAASRLIAVDYEALPVHLVLRASVTSVPIWPEASDNVAFDWQFGDAELCRQLFAGAAHTVRLHLSIPRVLPNPIEPRAAIGITDARDGKLTLISNTQGVHFVRGVLSQALRLPPKELRVVTPYVGGAFGVKIDAYPEHALVLLATRALGRPVRWTATRAEAVLSDTQGRGNDTEAALALDEDGRFLALSVRPTVDVGAYFSQLTPVVATGVGAPVQGGAYRFKAIEIKVRGVFTNKVPLDAYRGAGRPEATYVLERLIDRAASVLNIDPAELRAHNLPETQTETLTTVAGLPVAGGRFLDNQRRCLEHADRAGFAQRRTEAEKRGRMRGFGFANYLEANGGLQVADAIKPGSAVQEGVALTFGADGSAVVTIGTQSAGQNHSEPLALYVSSELGLDCASISVREGDSIALPVGSGTGGSKSTLVNSVAVRQAVADVVAKGSALLAREWGVDPSAIRCDRGLYSATGSNRTARFADLAARFAGAMNTDMQTGLTQGSSANGCHACEVEIDPATGNVEIIRYTAVDDFGEVIDGGDVLGQVQGGVAQGIGQALLECAPMPEALLHPAATSCFNYALPRAADVPDVDWTDNGLRSPTNVFGAKACGESGASAAPPAVMNAIVDALGAYPGAWKLQMPARPADIWAITRSGLHAARVGPGATAGKPNWYT